MKFLKLMALTILTFPVMTHAAWEQTDNVAVKLISVWSDDGTILVQTNPRPDISALSCTNDYWLVLEKDNLGYQAALSMLLAAQTTQQRVTVRAEDNGGNQFCKLSRVITIVD